MRAHRERYAVYPERGLTLTAAATMLASVIVFWTVILGVLFSLY